MNAPADFVAVVVDDPAGTDQLVTTAIAIVETPGEERTGLYAFATRKSSDAAWTASASLDGPSFAERGAVLLVYIDPSQPPVPHFAGTPVAGVTVTVEGAANAANDFYFSDPDVLVRETASVGLNVTDVNGSALYLNSTLTNHGGTGGEPVGCTWPGNLAWLPPGRCACRSACPAASRRTRGVGDAARLEVTDSRQIPR